MKRLLCSTLLVAAAALAGCDQSDHTITQQPDDPEGNAANAAAPVALPPSIAQSRIYRCKDNSVVYIDWLSDNKSANFRPERNASPVHMVAPVAGEKMVAADGHSLSGTAADASVTLERPGKGAQVCKA